MYLFLIFLYLFLLQLNTTQQQLKKDAEVADAQYRLTIKDFNGTQTAYEQEMKRILAEFQVSAIYRYRFRFIDIDV